MIQYYYELLNKEQQRAYYAMKAGLEAMAPSFPVPRLSGQELTDIFFMLRLDHPEIFYAVKFRYKYYPDSENVEMIPEYLFKKNKNTGEINVKINCIEDIAKEKLIFTEN